MRRGLDGTERGRRLEKIAESPGKRVGSARRGVDETILGVGELTRRIKSLLENSLGTVAVRGEVSGLKASPSGHVYFSLKDASALIDCVLWRSAAERIGRLPGNGDIAALRGRLGVYEPRGRYQLTVSSFVDEAAGKGDLWLRFEETRNRLAAEGLFDPGRKKKPPPSPGTVGIATSPSGAALRDMLKILARRAPGVRTVISPCLVQGREAGSDIVRALSLLERWGGADLIIVGRGGGSLEDLWPFNEEEVARFIAGMRTPVISAVGHETDFTLADFAADARAATPSEAAERAVPDRSELLGRVAGTARRLAAALAGLAREKRERLAGAARSRVFRRPEELFMPRWQRLDEAFSRQEAGAEALLAAARNRLAAAETRLSCLSPREVLARGYALALRADGTAIVNPSLISEGEPATVIVHGGGFEARAVRVFRDEKKD